MGNPYLNPISKTFNLRLFNRDKLSAELQKHYDQINMLQLRNATQGGLQLAEMFILKESIKELLKHTIVDNECIDTQVGNVDDAIESSSILQELENRCVSLILIGNVAKKLAQSEIYEDNTKANEPWMENPMWQKELTHRLKNPIESPVLFPRVERINMQKAEKLGIMKFKGR